MSKLGDKFKNIFTVDYDDDYEEDYYDDYEDDELEETVEKPVRQKRERTVVKEESSPKTSRTTGSFGTSKSTRTSRTTRNSKVVPMRSSDMEVCVIKPTYYESTRDIIDTLLEGKSVVLNLEGMKLDLAQRIVDSVSGGCYAIHGNLQKISGYIYLVTPSSVDITGDFQDLVSNETSDFSGSYSRRSY
ncbi:MAG: cell division protein SepF [Eubacterium sp.]